MNSFSKTLDTCPFLFRRHKFVKPLLALSLCGPIQEIEFNDGARLYGDIREPFPRSYFLTKFYNTEYCALARAFMAKGGHYFDIGANYGFCSFGILGDGTLLKDAELHLFEANPAMAELLQRSAKMFYPRHSIHIENAAVCNRNGESGFFLKNGHLGGSYLSAEGKLKVRNVTLDGYFEFNKIHEAVFMKMDIEGAESLALDGGKKIFSEGRVRALYIEVAAETLKKFNTAPDQLINKIRSLGFEVYYAAEEDFRLGIADKTEALNFDINGLSKKISLVRKYPESRETDLLAIHKASADYQRIQR